MISEKDIPKGWELKRLGDFVISEKGKKPKSLTKERTATNNLPYVNIKAFEQNIVDEYTNGDKCVFCEEGDFLLVWDGSRSGYVGRAIKGAVGSTLVKIRFPDIYEKYAYYFLQSKFIEINTRAKGVGIPHVDPNLVWNYQLLIPSKEEQQRIVEKIEELFSEVDKGIETLQTALQQLKTYRQSVLKHAFEGKLTHPEVKDGELPEGWKWVKVQDEANIYSGFAFKSKDFLPAGRYQVLRMGNVRPGVLRYEESPVFLNNVDENILDKVLLKPNDIIITQTGTRKKRDYGYTALIKKDNLLLNQRIAAIRFKPEYLPKFFLYFSWTDVFRDQFFANETGNVGQGNVGMRAITETLIPHCSVKNQQKIVSEIENRLSVADKLEENITHSLQQAHALKQSILKKAFEGKLIKLGHQAPSVEEFNQEEAIETIIQLSDESILHGAMTTCKYAYLIDRIEGVATNFKFDRGQLGPYDPAIKEIINSSNNIKQIQRGAYSQLTIVNENSLNRQSTQFNDLSRAIKNLDKIFTSYPDNKRSHKIELLATVCKVIEDIQSTGLEPVRQSMKEWAINLKTTIAKNKAQKFSLKETKDCINFIVKNGWEKKLIN